MPPKKKGSKAKKREISGKKLNGPKTNESFANQYRCDICLRFSFAQPQTLQQHKRTCRENLRKKLPVKQESNLQESILDAENQDLVTIYSAQKPKLICKECPKKFKFKESFAKHMREDHSNLVNSVQCAQCPVRCPNKMILSEHISKTHNKPLFGCPNCNKTFARSAHVSRHMRQGCQPEIAETYECEICDSTFTRKDNLMVHLRLHIQSKEYKCRQCPYYAGMSFKRLCSHWQNEHCGNRFECDVCGKETSSRASMIKHMEIHGDKKFACGVCNYTTHTIEVMRRHVLRHTDEKPFKCDLCPCSFIQIQQLRVHLQKHLHHPCDVCGRKFKSRAKYVAHKRTHGGNEPMVCPYDDCPFSKKPFAYEANFKDHLQSHIIKPHPCEVCKKSFPSDAYLKRHMVTHTLEKPRRCMYCVSARAYIRGEMLLRHVRVKHPAIFNEHLMHVRAVMQTSDTSDHRVKKSELESVLNLLDAVADRIIEQNVGENVLYGGMQDTDAASVTDDSSPTNTKDIGSNPLLSEEELLQSLSKLMTHLIDTQMLQEFGWPEESVDVVLEKVLEQCGQKPADRGRWSLVQRLRENAKHLFLHVVEDKATARMLSTHTIDQVIVHILRLSEESADDGDSKYVLGD